MTWKTLGAVAPAELVDARLQLHQAAQVVASAGLTFLEPQPDDSHPNLGWVEPLGALMGRRVPGAEVNVALRVSDLALLLVDARGQVSDELDLHGMTLDEAYAWLSSVTACAGAKLPSRGIVRSSYEIPAHPTAKGALFSLAPGAAFEELSRWFANGQQALQELATHTAGASEVRCWPHHFDLGSLAAVAKHADGSLASSIGFGLSPGDESYAEPYLYVSPWPCAVSAQLPALAGGGRWHTDGFVSAVLTGTDLAAGSPEGQLDRVRQFLDGAVDASRRALAD